jgi:hypothetical protein
VLSVPALETTLYLWNMNFEIQRAIIDSRYFYLPFFKWDEFHKGKIREEFLGLGISQSMSFI